MNALNILLIVFTLITSILQIILFFKIWKMTNDTSEIKRLLNISLYRKLPIEKRKTEVINNLYKLLYNKNIIVRYESREKIAQIISNAIDSYSEQAVEMIELYELTEIYSIDELKNDVTNRFHRFFN